MRTQECIAHIILYVQQGQSTVHAQLLPACKPFSKTENRKPKTELGKPIHPRQRTTLVIPTRTEALENDRPIRCPTGLQSLQQGFD